MSTEPRVELVAKTLFHAVYPDGKWNAPAFRPVRTRAVERARLVLAALDAHDAEVQA